LVLLALAKFMRLSLPKAAHAVVFSATWQEIRIRCGRDDKVRGDGSIESGCWSEGFSSISAHGVYPTTYAVWKWDRETIKTKAAITRGLRGFSLDPGQSKSGTVVLVVTRVAVTTPVNDWAIPPVVLYESSVKVPEK
jgi:hypothetical protein